jgi:hypothetical protein
MSLQLKPIRYYVLLKDSGNDNARMQFTSNGFDPIAAANLLDSLYDAVNAITDAKIMGYGFTYSYKENVETGASAKCQVEEYADVSVALVQSTPPDPGQSAWGQIKIPAPVDAMRVGALGSDEFDEVNPTYAPLNTFLELFEYGAGILPALVLSDGQTIDDPDTAGNVKGWIYTRKSRQGRKR